MKHETATGNNVRLNDELSDKPHAAMAGDLADEIKAAIYRYADKIPLAIALGVLRIVEHEILNDV